MKILRKPNKLIFQMIEQEYFSCNGECEAGAFAIPIKHSIPLTTFFFKIVRISSGKFARVPRLFRALLIKIFA